MPKKTKKSQRKIQAELVDLPDPGQLYDTLMAEIEPELQTVALPTLNAKYAGESSEETVRRMDRYTKAFREYEKRMRALLDAIAMQDRRYFRAMRKRAESVNRREEARDLRDLAMSIAQ